MIGLENDCASRVEITTGDPDPTFEQNIRVRADQILAMRRRHVPDL